MRIGAFMGMLHLLISVLGAGIITAFALYFIYQSGVQSSLREVEDLAYITENGLEGPLILYETGKNTTADIEAVLARFLRKRPEVHYTILSPEGSAYLPDSSACSLSDLTLDTPEIQSALVTSIGHSIRTCPQGIRMIYVATTIEVNDVMKGILVLAAPLDEMMAPTYRTMRWMGVIALLIVAVTVFEGWVGSIYISRPLAGLSRIAEQYSQGDLSARAESIGPVEVIHLAHTLNALAARVQGTLDAMRGFVANASHELRTPLTTLKLQVDALKSGACEDPAVAHRFLDQIDNEIDRLSYLVSDMLDLSLIEGGGPAPVMQPVNLEDLASEVRDFWQPRSHHAELTLAFEAEENIPNLQGDPFRLRQLFDNLLDNAIKHTPPGGRIDMRLRRVTHGKGAALREVVRVEIRDTGRGIAEEHLAHIFDRFYRIEMKRAGVVTDRPDGSGLGLAIARSIVAAHCGEIGAESQPGAGSLFWVEFPLVDKKATAQ